MLASADAATGHEQGKDMGQPCRLADWCLAAWCVRPLAQFYVKAVRLNIFPGERVERSCVVKIPPVLSRVSLQGGKGSWARPIARRGWSCAREQFVLREGQLSRCM